MQTLLIADCNEEFRLAVSEALQQHFRVISCGTGPLALQLLRQESPDLLLLDLMLPELDGLTLLETAVAEGQRPKVLIASAIVTGYIVQCAEQLGICYIIRKPCQFSALVARLLDLAKEPVPDIPATLSARTAQLLLNFGFKTTHDGQSYAITALPMVMQNPRISATKELYPAVAKRHGCLPGHVERGLRSAITYAYLHGDPQLWAQHFPGLTQRPSNLLFLTTLAKLLQQDQE